MTLLEMITLRRDEVSTYELDLAIHRTCARQWREKGIPPEWPANCTAFQNMNRSQLVAEFSEDDDRIPLVVGLQSLDIARGAARECEVELIKSRHVLKALEALADEGSE